MFWKTLHCIMNNIHSLSTGSEDLRHTMLSVERIRVGNKIANGEATTIRD